MDRYSGQDVCGNANIISARVPLANIFSYAKILRAISQGRATSIMQFDHYAPAPLADHSLEAAAGVRGLMPLVPALVQTNNCENDSLAASR